MRGVARAFALAFVVLVACLTAPAAVAATCGFDAGTATVTVQVGDGESSLLARSGDAITLDGSPCDTATVSNTDAIVVNATGTPASISIDLGGGDFAPGLSAESDGGSSEIEFTINLPAGTPTLGVIGGEGDDTVVVEAGGINLNAAEPVEDADVLINGQAAIVLEGNGGSDLLSGGEGDDRIGGGPGNDVLEGGPGTDTVLFGPVDAGVQVDLRDGTAQGEGDDSLLGFENVMGTKHADTLQGDQGSNKLAGGAGRDVLFADDGADVLRGGPGNDELTGGRGHDGLIGGSGRDQLDGGNGEDVCKGGPDPDSFVFCENIALG